MVPRLDTRQLRMIEKALPFAPKWAQKVCSDLPGTFQKDTVISVVNYHIVDQARLYKDKDEELYFKALQYRVVSLTKETLCYEFFEQKRDSTQSEKEGKRVYKSTEVVYLDTLTEDQLGYDDLDIENLLAVLDQSEIIKGAFGVVDNQEKLVIFRLYYLEERAVDVAKSMGVSGGRIGQIKRSALDKMRTHLERREVA